MNVKKAIRDCHWYNKGLTGPQLKSQFIQRLLNQYGKPMKKPKAEDSEPKIYMNEKDWLNEFA